MSFTSCETKTTTPDKPNLFVQVVNQQDQPQDFAYTITPENRPANAASDRAFGQVALKMEAPVSYSVEVNVGSYIETKKGVTWPANTAKVLRFEFNDEEGEFVLDADDNTPLDQIDETGITDAQKDKEKQKGIPDGWVEGRFYNANNVSCQYAGQSLVFIHQGADLYNIETKKITQAVVVPVGKSVAVAAPANGAFLRVFLSAGAEDPSGLGDRIAFVRFDEMYTGWWFAAGCKDGSKPPTNCNNGNGYTGIGSACTTLGEDS
ncbi:MAG: hypothetical protein ABJM06_07135 [Gilvibacter sp.]